MQYNININQKAIIDSGLSIDYKDAAILDVCIKYGHSSSCIKMEFSGKIYYWFDHNKIAKELPLLSLKKDSVYRRMKKMCEVGLVIQHPENEKMGKSFYSFQDLTLGLYSEPSDKKTDTLGKPSVEPSDKKPTDHYTNDHYTNDQISCSEQVPNATDLNLKIIDLKISKESSLEEKIIKNFHSLFCSVRTKYGKPLTNKILLNQKVISWKEDLDAIMRIDKRTRSDLLEVYEFLEKGEDKFWRRTILSLDGLREHYDKIVDKMEAEREKKKGKQGEVKEGVFQGNINRVTKSNGTK